MTDIQHKEELGRILTMPQDELKKAIQTAHIFQQSLKDYLQAMKIHRTQVLKACNISQDQYYRNMKNPHRWELSHLETISTLQSEPTGEEEE